MLGTSLLEEDKIGLAKEVNPKKVKINLVLPGRFLVFTPEFKD